MNNFQKGILLLFSSALLYSIMPILIRTLGAGHIPPISQVFLRYIFAFLSALTYYIFTKSKNELKKKNLVFIVLLGIFGYGLTNLFFTYGMIYTQISTALFIFYSYGVITPILGYLLLKEKINLYNSIALTLGILALLLLFTPSLVNTWKLGAIFALLSSLGQSIYVIGRKKLFNYSSKFLLLSNTFVGVIALGAIAIIFENSFYFGNQPQILNINSTTWLLTILFGIDNFLAWLLMSMGFQLVKATTGSLVLLVENVFALSFALLFFGEFPTLTTIFGGILILTASGLAIFKGDNS